ncbi:hypothetical protein HGRIS_006535 [Hohenbuehelia grisea]|uniref:Uncharacterized protein n=1 Tax=Hohenbuehelia grisea TaxID=104357 RepID=A0ABR3J9S7_9AGAR
MHMRGALEETKGLKVSQLIVGLFPQHAQILLHPPPPFTTPTPLDDSQLAEQYDAETLLDHPPVVPPGWNRDVLHPATIPRSHAKPGYRQWRLGAKSKKRNRICEPQPGPGPNSGLPSLPPPVRRALSMPSGWCVRHLLLLNRSSRFDAIAGDGDCGLTLKAGFSSPPSHTGLAAFVGLMRVAIEL